MGQIRIQPNPNNDKKTVNINYEVTSTYHIGYYVYVYNIIPLTLSKGHQVFIIIYYHYYYYYNIISK